HARKYCYVNKRRSPTWPSVPVSLTKVISLATSSASWESHRASSTPRARTFKTPVLLPDSVLRMIRILALMAAFLLALGAFGSPAHYDLFATGTMRLINADAKSVNYHGHRALQLTAVSGKEDSDEGMLAVLAGPDFKDGTIEVELSGAPRKGVPENMRGFIGIAFRIQGEGEKFECFYLRPSNGRAPDQLQRNHS